MGAYFRNLLTESRLADVRYEGVAYKIQPDESKFVTNRKDSKKKKKQVGLFLCQPLICAHT